MAPAMMGEKLRIVQRRCSPNRPAKIIRKAVHVVNQVQDGEPGGRHQAGVSRRREDQARHPERGGSPYIGGHVAESLCPVKSTLYGGGSIARLSSIAGVAGQARQSTWGPAKFVATGLTKHLPVGWAAHGIRVNAGNDQYSAGKAAARGAGWA
jgi:NAD(P)-dependent dehydrogenase (short-subunit alcohol dehydrogenase family)